MVSRDYMGSIVVGHICDRIQNFRRNLLQFSSSDQITFTVVHVISGQSLKPSCLQNLLTVGNGFYRHNFAESVVCICHGEHRSPTKTPATRLAERPISGYHVLKKLSNTKNSGGSYTASVRVTALWISLRQDKRK